VLEVVAFKLWPKKEPSGGAGADDALATVRVRAPWDCFDRAEVFLEDLAHRTNQELEGVTITFLVKLLFDNFLHEVRTGGHQLLEKMSAMRKEYGKLLEEAEGEEAKGRGAATGGAGGFDWALSRKRRGGEGGCRVLLVKLPRADARRVEVFFSDLEWRHRRDLGMTLDELLSLLFVEFIGAVRSGSITGELLEDITDSVRRRWASVRT